MKISESRDRATIGPGEVTGARAALTRAISRYEEDGELSHLLTGVEAALAHLGITIEEEG